MNRRTKRILKRMASVFVVVALVAMMILLFTSGMHQAEPKQTMTYTVQHGDTLYSIAEEMGVKNWRKWSFEVCEINGLEQGGLIHPGQDIVVWQ